MKIIVPQLVPVRRYIAGFKEEEEEELVQASQSNCSTSRHISFKVDWPLSKVSAEPWQGSLPSRSRHSCLGANLKTFLLPMLTPSSHTLDFWSHFFFVCILKLETWLRFQKAFRMV